MTVLRRCALSLALVGLVLTSAHAPDATAESLVRQEPVAGTPHVLDGQVEAVVQLGDTMVLGGSFTQVREDGSSEVLVRRGLVAFDKDTGEVDGDFAPQVRGGEVATLLAAPDGSSVYVGGKFTDIDGRDRPKLARLRLSNGSLVNGFDPGRVGGPVRDLALTRGKLFVAGGFTDIAGRDRRALATLDPSTGRYLGYADLDLRGTYNGGFTTVMKIDVTRDRKRLVAIGNFMSVDGKSRPQVFQATLGDRGMGLAGWRTGFYGAACDPRFETAMRDVDFSPNGRFFVIATTGGYGSQVNGPCDAAARFETRARGSNVRYSWLANTGGDTSTGVLTTDEVTYIGGHFSYWNNSYAVDEAGPGAVERQGLAALSADNGLPFTWNPVRDPRGYGVLDFLLTGDGLWFTSDTDRVAGQYRGRVALLPPGGVVVPQVERAVRLDDVYIGDPAPSVGGDRDTGLVRRPYSRSFGAVQSVPRGDLDWSRVTAAFLLDAQLYAADLDGDLTRRRFDGTGYGPPVTVDTSDAVVPDSQWHLDLAGMTGMFYDAGRIFYTIAGDNRLHMRYFNAQSGVVGVVDRVVARGTQAIDYRQVRGMFRAGGQLYFATSGGALKRIAWRTRPQGGAPATLRSYVVSSPGKDGRSWEGRTVFVADAS